jgi:hypothetical protein
MAWQGQPTCLAATRRPEKQAQGAGDAWTTLGGGQGLVLRTHPPQTVPHRRRGEPSPTRANRRHVGSRLVSPRGVTAASVTAMPQEVQDDGTRERQAVIGGRGGATSPHAPARSLPSGLAARERVAHRARRASTCPRHALLGRPPTPRWTGPRFPGTRSTGACVGSPPVSGRLRRWAAGARGTPCPLSSPTRAAVTPLPSDG